MYLAGPIVFPSHDPAHTHTHPDIPSISLDIPSASPSFLHVCVRAAAAAAAAAAFSCQEWRRDNGGGGLDKETTDQGKK